MPSNASDTITCATCGGALTGTQCPRCLFKITFGEEDEPLTQDEVPWTRLASCELFEEIGRGGMGVVYRARQRGLDRVVAVKVLLRAQFAGKEERERFHREAQAAARLRHPGIVSIIDVGEDDGVPWFSMEHIAGKSLEQLVREHPMDAHEAARCVKLVAEALQHAHEHGVLHRDLKPSNILLDEENEPHITDFGIARIGTSSTTAAQLTRTGQVLGSPGYAAPEQALAGSAEVRTDVYGLGALLYHLLTGRPPFQGPTLDAILVQLRENEPLSPRRLNPSVPRDLETICLKCLQKAPEARYASATDVAEDLGRFLNGSAILARPISLPGRLWRWTRRHPGIAAMLAIIVLLISGLVGGSLAFARHQARMEHRTLLISEARSLRQTRLAGSRTEALAKLREAWAIRPSMEIRNEVAACLALPEIGALRRLSPADDKAKAPDPSRSANGERMATMEGSDILVREVTSNREIKRLSGFKAGAMLKLDDDGARLAIADAGSGVVKLIRVSDAHLIATCEHPLLINSIDWSGELIATGCDNRFIYIWEANGTLRHRLSGHEAVPIRVSFRPRSQELVSTSMDTHVRLWHGARGEEIMRAVQEHQPHRSLWWSEDGGSLFGGCEDGSAEVFSFQGGDVVRVLSPPQEEPHSENLGSAAFSADGRLAAVIDEVGCRLWNLDSARLIHAFPKAPGQWLSAQFGQGGRLLWLSGWDTALTSYLLENEGEAVSSPTETNVRHGSLIREISADGQHLVLNNNSAGEFIVFTPATRQSVRLKHPGGLAAALSPQGTWLATSSYRSRDLRLWSLPDGKLLLTLIKGETVMQLIADSHGRRLLCNLGKELRSFSTDDWQELPVPPLARAHGLVLSPDGRYLAALGEDHLRLIDARTMQETQRLALPAYAGWLGDGHILFDADGSHLMVHTALGSVCRWDLQRLNHEMTDRGFVK